MIVLMGRMGLVEIVPAQVAMATEIQYRHPHQG
ncbi:hypothetical protein KYC_26572 [Achromobacter arsenitoxydans SY8]|uniref:Uncharacterized protein n=1 Tax=Achromobacter arsenitoxydans SY8 TaxID=477184 RepID=H0FEV0_9BURK|nr:hypothetical protein KYC_26572 [Achromobacter arsenitoxydans SY8]